MIINGRNYCPSCFDEIGTDNKCICGYSGNELNVHPGFLKIGSVLSENLYVGKVIGAGAFGVTYLGFDADLETKIAIKEFFREDYSERNSELTNEVSVAVDKQSDYESELSKFLAEARTLAKFSKNEGFVSVFRTFRENNTAYIVMEYVEGNTLEQIISTKGKLTANDTLRIMTPVIHAIKCMHEKNIIHRDINPRNIMVDKRNRPKVLDLGTSRNFDNELSKTAYVTSGYTPIEQYSVHGSQGPWTDIYAICATMYSCIIGKAPMSAFDREEVDDHSVKDEMTKAGAGYLADVVSKGMEIYSEDRFQSIDELIAAIEDAVNNQNREVNDGAGEKKSFIEKIKQLAPKKKAVLLSAIIVVIGLVIIISVKLSGGRKLDNPHSESLPGQESLGEDPEGKSVAEDLTSQSEEDSLSEADDKSEKHQIETYKAVLTYNGNDNPSNAFAVVKARLENIVGAENVELIQNDNSAEIDISLSSLGDFNPNKLMKNRITIGGRTYIVYDDNNYLEITPDDVKDVSTSVRGFDGINRSDNAAREYKNSEYNFVDIKFTDDFAQRVQALYEKLPESDRTFIGAKLFVNKYDEKSKSLTDRKYSRLAEDNLYIVFDFDRYLDGSREFSDLAYCGLTAVSENGEKFSFLADGSTASVSNMMFNITGAKIDGDFECTLSEPVVWEYVESLDGSVFAAGNGQVNPEYFKENNIAGVDVVFSKDNASFGDKYDYSVWIREVLDAAGMKYSVGALSYDENSVVIRIDKQLTGIPYFNLMGPEYTYFYAGETISGSTYHAKNYTDTEFISSIEFVEEDIPKVIVKFNKLNSQYTEFAKECANNYDGIVTWSLGTSSVRDYAWGTLDAKSGVAVFDKSSLSADGQIPPCMDSIIDLMNAAREINSSDKALTNYMLKYSEDMPAPDDLSRESDYGIEGALGKVSAEKLAVDIEDLIDFPVTTDINLNSLNINIELPVSDTYVDDVLNALGQINEAGYFEYDNYESLPFRSKTVTFSDSKSGMKLEAVLSFDTLIVIRYREYLVKESLREDMAVYVTDIFNGLQDSPIKKDDEFELYFTTS